MALPLSKTASFYSTVGHSGHAPLNSHTMTSTTSPSFGNNLMSQLANAPSASDVGPSESQLAKAQGVSSAADLSLEPGHTLIPLPS